MVACSFCGGVEAPGWFTSNGLWVGIGALVLLGLIVGMVGLLRADWQARSGALRIGLGLAVFLPAAALVAQVGDTRVDVTVDGQAPLDGDAWSVSCETFQEPPDAGNEMQEAFVDSCASATRPARWTALVLAMAAAALAIDGARHLVAARARPQKLDDVAMSV